MKCANLVTPLDSGTSLIGSSFYVHLGLQIGLNFVPANENGNVIFVGREIEFFCGLECA